MQVRDPYWICRIESHEMDARTAVRLATWLDTLQGGLKSVLVYDQAAPHPRAYGVGAAGEAAVLALTRAGGGAFDGTFEITDILNGGLSLESRNTSAPRAPANFTLSEGDYIGLEMSGKYSLHRVTETVTSSAGTGVFNSAGGTLISIYPPAKSNIFVVGAGAVQARTIRPQAECRVDPESIEYGPNSRTTKIGFTAYSVAY